MPVGLLAAWAAALVALLVADRFVAKAYSDRFAVDSSRRQAIPLHL